MKIHTLKIPEDGMHLEGEESNEMLELRDPNALPVSPIRYSLDVGISDGGLWAVGTLGVDVRCQCVKCLEFFVFPLEVSEFATQVELTRVETVDLTEPMREDILLALPAHPHCDWSGEKACPGAFPSASAEANSIGEPSDRPDVWGALDQIKLEP